MAAQTILDQIQHTVASVLRLGNIATNVSLVELGASSMDLMRIINQLEDQLGVRLEFDEINGAPTMESLAAAVGACTALASPMHTNAPPTSERPDLIEPMSAMTVADGLRGADAQLRYTLQSSAGAAAALQSTRAYGAQSLPAEQLGNLLDCLRIHRREGSLRARYGSAGALFPVQVYVYLKNARVKGLTGGLYYYHPLQHELLSLAPQLVIDANMYEPLHNAPLFQRAAFSLFLISRPRAIEPVYGRRARDFCLLEAGSMAQLLREAGSRLGVGLCPMGEIRFEAVRSWFDLEADQECLYSFIGGSSADSPAAALSSATDTAAAQRHPPSGNQADDPLSAFRVR